MRLVFFLWVLVVISTVHRIQVNKEFKAIRTIETYTGEIYNKGDCEAKQIYETADEEVEKACNLIEN